MTKPTSGMSFQDFLERTASDTRRFKALLTEHSRNRGLPLPFMLPDLGESRIFFLGEDEDIQKAIAPIRDDISADCREGIPMPFSDVSCVSRVPFQGQSHWILDRVIEAPAGRKEGPPEPERIAAAGWTVKQRLFISRHTELDRSIMGDLPVPTMWDSWFCGVAGDGSYRMLNAMDPSVHAVLKTIGMGHTVDETFEALSRETVPILEQLAAVSHPGNYILKATPRLTPHEERRAAAGKPPTGKRPHFIVVDHDVLVAMSGRGAGGTHASPVPHERRGHWMRLAERCRHARLLGRDRVFVRPAYVGERTFSDPKNLYEVLLDFGKKGGTDGSA